MAEGDPTDPAEAFRRSMEDADKFNRERNNDPRYQLPPLLKLNFYIEKNRLPEKGEYAADYRKAGIDIMSPLLKLQLDARTNFDFNDFSVVRCAEMLDRSVTDFQQAVQGAESFSSLGDPEVSGLAKVMNTDLIRMVGFHTLEKHTIGFKNFYFDKSGVFRILITGRRHGAVNAGDWMAMFRPLEGMELNVTETEALKIPEREFCGEEVSKMTADIDHFDRAVGAMNRYNAFKPSGSEMFMKVTETEQKLLGKLFVLDGKSDHGSEVDSDFEPKKTEEINVTVTEGGRPVKKTFYTNLLSYYVTAEPEQDRRKYEATMKALAEVGALNKLKAFPEIWLNVRDVGDGITIDHKTKFDTLLREIETTRDRILANWNSLVKPVRARYADFAYEQNFNVQTGSQNVAELAYRFVWKKTDGEWDFAVEIPGPEIGQDVVNGRAPLTHELIYKVIKGRGVTNIMPWPKRENVNEMIKITLGETRGKDPRDVILKDPRLAKGAATIGLYPGEVEKLLTKDDLKQVELSRHGMRFNETALKVLDSMLWIYDLSADGCYMPMPIKPMYDSFNLFKAMKDATTGETVFEAINKTSYKTLRDVDFKKMTWYSGDAWEVNMKMIEDTLTLMYGRQDAKYVDSFMADKMGGMGDFIKKLDIGMRSEKWEVDVRKSLNPTLPNGRPNPDYSVYEKVEVPKGFIEIMQTAYLFVTHMALVKFKIWDKGGWSEHNQNNFWEDVQSLVTVAAYEPPTKGKFDHYTDSLQLMIVAIAEWYAASAKAYNNMAAGLKDQIDVVTPRKEAYTEPTVKIAR